MKLTEIAYFTDNVSEMTAFYQGLLGNKPVAQSENMAIFMTGETKIFIHQTYTSEKDDLPPDNHMAFTVDDVDEACEALSGRGLILEVPPKDYYWGRSAYLRDPDGNLIEITQEESRQSQGQ